MSDVDCPYCGKGVDICHDDGFACEDGFYGQYECPWCEKSFMIDTSISIDHDAYPAPCLNGDAEHDFQMSKTFPVECARCECRVCKTPKPPEATA